MTAILLTPGFHGPYSGIALANDDARCSLLGVADRDYMPGELFDVLWRQHQPSPVGWAEFAIGTGDIALGNPTISLAGFVDVTQEVGAYVGSSTASLPLVHPLPAGSPLYLVTAAWVPPGWSAAYVVGSMPADPIGSGVLGAMRVPGYKPSGWLGIPIAFDAQPPILRSMAAMVRAPAIVPPPEEP